MWQLCVKGCMSGSRFSVWQSLSSMVGVLLVNFQRHPILTLNITLFRSRELRPPSTKWDSLFHVRQNIWYYLIRCRKFFLAKGILFPFCFCYAPPPWNSLAVRSFWYRNKIHHNFAADKHTVKGSRKILIFCLSPRPRRPIPPPTTTVTIFAFIPKSILLMPVHHRTVPLRHREPLSEGLLVLRIAKNHRRGPCKKFKNIITTNSHQPTEQSRSRLMQKGDFPSSGREKIL